MDRDSLHRLEFVRVCEAVATLARCDRARDALRSAGPIADAAERGHELGRLAEAIRRCREPGPWCAVGRGSLAADIEAGESDGWDGSALRAVLEWLTAGAATTAAWQREDVVARFPRLAELVAEVPALEPLREAIDRSIEPDGRVSDAASPALARARRELAQGERRLHARMERWASEFGEGSYVTRHGDRFVALVPAAGFSRKRALVHDVSNSGQSLFVEPLDMCEDNNRLMEHLAVVAEEERRVLRELAAAVGRDRDALLALEDALARLDALRARGLWAAEHDGQAILPGGDALVLRSARHPLLAMSDRRASIVPLDLSLGGEGGRLLLVSGPNMGGKTIVLKTVGLALALAHAGFPVLAGEGSRLPEVDEILADVGDEQSVDRGLSTFAAHVAGLKAMAESAGPRSLLLADELGAGTDPEEGAALGRALLERFAAARAWAVVTTHLGSLKRASAEVPGIVNGSLEFDLATLEPRYRFLPGVPGASHALAVAGRLGFPREVLARASTFVSDESRALERLLAEIGEARRATDAERATLLVARAEAERAAAAHREATEMARRTVEDLRRRLTRESEALLARARELWQGVQREAKRADKSREGAARLKQDMDAIETEARALERLATPEAIGMAEPQPAAEPFRVQAGLRVRVVDLGVEAEVVSGPDPDGRVQLRRGSWSIQAQLSRLGPARGEERKPERPTAASFDRGDDPPPLEVDLRGQEVDEALRNVDQGLDRAVLAGLGEVRIIHGIGRGVLRTAVEKHLRTHPQVESQRLGEGHEGGRGVTVARLR